MLAEVPYCWLLFLDSLVIGIVGAWAGDVYSFFVQVFSTLCTDLHVAEGFSIFNEGLIGARARNLHCLAQCKIAFPISKNIITKLKKKLKFSFQHSILFKISSSPPLLSPHLPLPPLPPSPPFFFLGPPPLFLTLPPPFLKIKKNTLSS